MQHVVSSVLSLSTKHMRRHPQQAAIHMPCARQHSGEHLATLTPSTGGWERLTASPCTGPVTHTAILRCCLPAEHMRGTPNRLSPMLAACAATTLAAWTCSVRETASDVGPSLGPWPSEDTACSTAAECTLSSLFSPGAPASILCLQLSLITQAAICSSVCLAG